MVMTAEYGDTWLEKRKGEKKVSLRLNLQEMPTGSEWEVLFLAIRRSTKGSGERMIDARLRKKKRRGSLGGGGGTVAIQMSAGGEKRGGC